MEPQARYTVVGASVLLLACVIVASLAWLLTSGTGKDLRRYTLYFKHQSLEGLEVNGEVRMKGIRVGSVTGFDFSARHPDSVEVQVDVNAVAPVRTSTRAVVDRNLITGLATIRLVTLEDNSPLLRDTVAGDAVAAIPEGESQMQQFSQTMSQLAQHADETMQRISMTLSSSNQAALAETLDNLRVASRGASALRARTDATLVSISEAATSLKIATATAASDFHHLAERYDALAAKAGAGVDEAANAARRVSDDVSRLSERSEQLMVDADVQLRLTGQQVRAAADAVGMTTRKLADPGAALFGPATASLGPGESKQ